MIEYVYTSYQQFRYDYSSKKVSIGINLLKARKLLTDMRDTSTMLWYLIFAAICIISFFIFDNILWALLFDVIFIAYLGIGAIAGPIKEIIFVASLIGVFISSILFLFFATPCLFVLYICVCLCLVYLFYNSIGKKLINMALTNEKVLKGLIQDGYIALMYA